MAKLGTKCWRLIGSSSEEDMKDKEDTKGADLGTTTTSASGGTSNQCLPSEGYEKLCFNTRERTEMEVWLEANNVSEGTCKRLRDQMILTLADLQELRDKDITRLDLVMGEQLRLRASIRKLQTAEQQQQQ